MSIVPIASDDTDGISSVTTDANYDIGISRIGNTIEIIAGNAENKDMKVCIYNASGMCLMSKALVNGSARISLSGKGLCIIKVYNDRQAIYTTKLIY